MLTLHEALGDKFTTMLEVRRVGVEGESHPNWIARPSFTLGKQPIFRGLGRGFGAFGIKRFAYESVVLTTGWKIIYIPLCIILF